MRIPEPRKLPSGRWYIQVQVDGERQSAAFDTPADAQYWAASVKAGQSKQKKAAQRLSRTLEQAIDDYILAREKTESPATIRGYESLKRNHFKGLMQKNAYTITREQVQAEIDKETLNYSGKTIANAYGLLRPVLNEQCGVDVSGVKLPQVLKPSRKYIQPEEIGALIREANNDRYGLEVMMLVWLGLRLSELLGLWWDCVDFNKSTISIRRKAVPDRTSRYVLCEGAKNMPSQRTISCPPQIMDGLRARWTVDAEGAVFPDTNRETLRRHVHRICKQAGITDTTLHGLRHTNAAVMKHIGIEDGAAMKRGGWTNEATYKQTYSYVFESAEKSSDRQINQFFAEQIESKKAPSKQTKKVKLHRVWLK